MKDIIDEIKWFWKWNVKYPWYDFRRGIQNLYTHFSVVWKSGDFDYAYILRMTKFKLERLEKVLQDGYEVDKDRLPKVEDIKRCIELINNKLEDNYAERCGYQSDRTTIEFEPIDEELNGEKLFVMVNKHPKPQSNEELREIFKKAHELEKEEWAELWDTIKKGNKSDRGMNGWWD